MERNAILKKRMENLEKRKEMLREIDIDSTITQMKPEKKVRKKREPVAVNESTRRKSRRLNGLAPEYSLDEAMETADRAEYPDETAKVKIVREFKDAYKNLDLSGIEIPIRVDGTFHGDIDPVVAKRCGIPTDGEIPETTPEEPEKEEKRPAIRRKGGSYDSAKERSRRALKTNPNSYFYRHVEPNLEQWQGDWTEEEIRAFCLTAQKFGCGDKWGLFSTYIPHRVGYQCSNFYRQYILPKGLVVDPNYTITAYGEAIYRARPK